MTWSALEIVAVPWGIITGLYLVLFLYRSVVGMKEEDTLYLSAGESRLAAEQHEIMKHINKLDAYAHKLGFATAVMTGILAVTWGYSVYKQLF